MPLTNSVHQTSFEYYTSSGDPHPDTWQYIFILQSHASFVPRDPNAHGGQRNPLDLQIAHHAQHRAVLFPYKALAAHLTGGEKRKAQAINGETRTR